MAEGQLWTAPDPLARWFNRQRDHSGAIWPEPLEASRSTTGTGAKDVASAAVIACGLWLWRRHGRLLRPGRVSCSLGQRPLHQGAP